MPASLLACASRLCGNAREPGYEEPTVKKNAVAITLALLGTLAAILLHEREAPDVIEPLDRMERAIIQLGAQAQPEPATGPAVEVITPPLPRPQDDARESAIRGGDGIVDS